MKERVKRLKQGEPLVLGIMDDVPLTELRLQDYPDWTKGRYAEEINYSSRTISRLSEGKTVGFLRTYQGIIAYHGLELAIFENGEMFTKDLDLEKLFKVEEATHELIINDVGLSKTYFRSKIESNSYALDNYRDILHYLGYELAIVRRGRNA